jgi:hypothetical protein
VKYLIKQALSARPDILEGMAKRGVRIIIIAATEQVTDIPEYSHMDEYWNRRARGFGGRTTSCGEENLLNYEGDRYVGEKYFSARICPLYSQSPSQGRAGIPGKIK